MAGPHTPHIIDFIADHPDYRCHDFALKVVVALKDVTMKVVEMILENAKTRRIFYRLRKWLESKISNVNLNLSSQNLKISIAILTVKLLFQILIVIIIIL